MIAIERAALLFAVIGLAGCATQEAPSINAKSTSLRDDFSCDATYSLVETCHKRGASYDAVEHCEGLSIEWGKAFDVIDDEVVGIATELCMVSCQSGFAGELPPTIAEICAKS